MSKYQKATRTNGIAEYQFHQNKPSTTWESVKLAFYDKSANEILGRTPESWAKLLIFYTMFYAVLAAMFAICMLGLDASLDDRSPTRKLEDSLIGENPGLAFRPTSQNLEEGILIRYNQSNFATSQKWVRLLDEFLEPYRREQTGKPFANCDFDKPPGNDRVCTTKMEQFANCNPKEMYGYNTSSPCVFIKLNRVYGWVPRYHDKPIEGMPAEMVSHMTKLNKLNSQQVWVSCNGLSAKDKANIQGFHYYPHGFPSYYYPYTNVAGYLSPLVAVKISGLRPNVVVSIECRAWARNIEYRSNILDRSGSVVFQIRVDADVEEL